MFYGRDEELKKLEGLYESDKFECSVIYGRRRIGKTRLIREFIKGKKAFYFQAINTDAQENLKLFSRIYNEIENSDPEGPVFTAFDSFFNYLMKVATNEKIVIVIDEYPYLAENYEAISSLLQYYIDHEYSKTDMTLILCGSSMSFMEKQVMGYQSPLYGRRTAQLKIEPLSVWDVNKFLPKYNSEEKFIAHAVSGGTPYYLTLFDDSRSIEENIQELFLKRDALLFQEAQTLMLQEFREPGRYEMIIRSIAEGATKRNEIATKTGLEYSKLSPYLDSLINLGFIERETPVLEKPGRKSIYVLKDGYFRFWYRFIYQNVSGITSRPAEQAYKKYIEPHLSDWLGKSFEELAIEWCKRNREELAVDFDTIGRWWGNNPSTRSQDEIDIIAADKHSMLLGECKYRNVVKTKQIYEDMKKKGNLFKQFKEVHYVLFSKVDCKEANKELSIVTLEKMIK